jgi:hypothetical protein
MLTRLPAPARLAQLLAVLTALGVLALNPAVLRGEADWPSLLLCAAILFDLTGGAVLIQRLARRPADPLPVVLTGALLAVVLLPALRPLALGVAGVSGLALVGRTLSNPDHLWRRLLRAPWTTPQAGPGERLLTTHVRGNWTVYVWMYLLMDLPLHVFFAFAGLHVLSLVDLGFVLVLALAARSFRAYPCLLTTTHLHLNMGAVYAADLPLDDIRAAQPYVPTREGLSLVTLTPPNVTLWLVRPVQMRSLLNRAPAVTVLHLYLDEPAALLARLPGGR